jgi:hypothetical protein
MPAILILRVINEFGFLAVGTGNHAVIHLISTDAGCLTQTGGCRYA